MVPSSRRPPLRNWWELHTPFAPSICTYNTINPSRVFSQTFGKGLGDVWMGRKSGIRGDTRRRAEMRGSQDDGLLRVWGDWTYEKPETKTSAGIVTGWVGCCLAGVPEQKGKRKGRCTGMTAMTAMTWTGGTSTPVYFSHSRGYPRTEEHCMSWEFWDLQLLWPRINDRKRGSLGIFEWRLRFYIEVILIKHPYQGGG